jgi:hypothetical protein
MSGKRTWITCDLWHDFLCRADLNQYEAYIKPFLTFIPRTIYCRLPKISKELYGKSQITFALWYDFPYMLKSRLHRLTLTNMRPCTYICSNINPLDYDVV